MATNLGSLSALQKSKPTSIVPVHVSREEQIKQLMGIFQINTEILQQESMQAPEELCFEKALQLCENSNWSTIEKIQNILVGFTDLYGRSLFSACVEQGLTKQVQEIVQNEHLKPLYEKEFFTAGHVAAKRGLIEVFAVLVQQGLDIDAPDENKQTPLHVAIQNGQQEFVEMLLMNGASIDVITPFPKTGNLPFQLNAIALCVATCQVEILDLIISIKGKNSDNLLSTATVKGIGNLLHVAVHFGQHMMLKHLLEQHFALTQTLLAAKNDDYTPLHLAAALGDIASIYYLANRKGAEIDVKDSQERTPLHLAALNLHKEAIRMLWYLGANFDVKDKDFQIPYQLIPQEPVFESKQVQGLIRTLSKQKVEQDTQPPNFEFYPPENLVFKGGGPKGIAYVGAIEELEQRNKLDSIKRVAGTSAGAITAMLLALGYNSKEVHALLQNTPLDTFLDHPLKVSNLKKAVKENLTLKALFNLIIHPEKILHKLNPATLFESLWHLEGICEGDVALDWLEARICAKTKRMKKGIEEEIKNCTFGELKQLIEEGKGFKHLHVFGIKIGEKPEIVHFSTEDDNWKDLIIADAVRISMSIPGVFKPYKPRFKNDRGDIYTPEIGKYVDGGLIYNFPIECFDRKRYVENSYRSIEADYPIFSRKTLGFSLYTPEKEENNLQGIEKEPKNVKDLLVGVYSIFRHAETLIRQLNPYNQHRVIEVSNTGVGTLEFSLTEDKQQALIQSGKNSTAAFFARQPTASSFLQLPGSKKKVTMQ